MLTQLIAFVRSHPGVALASGLGLVLFIAITMGIARRASMPSEDVQNRADGSSLVDEGAIAVPDAPSVPSGLAPAADLDAVAGAGAKDTWFSATSSGAYARIGTSAVADAMGVFEWPRAWELRESGQGKAKGYVRYRREGMVRIVSEGPYGITLLIERRPFSRGECRFALGDLGSTIVTAELREGLVAAEAVLRPGFYPAALECDLSATALPFSVKLALLAPEDDQPEVIRFYQLDDRESEPVETAPTGDQAAGVPDQPSDA